MRRGHYLTGVHDMDGKKNTPIRLDLLVMERRGFTREYAKEVIESGMVYVNGAAVSKPGAKFSRFTDEIEISAPDMPFAGRGGYKLEAALSFFNADVSGLVCLDAGASTGGFTDCMLKRGAKKVYAADVGHGQLLDVLRADSRVVSMEGTDIRSLVLPELIGFAAADVSFISLTKIIPCFKGLLRTGAGLVCLIKPQFETGARLAGKRGVVIDEGTRRLAVAGVMSCLNANGFETRGVIDSPITGRGGNKEYLAYALYGGGDETN